MDSYSLSITLNTRDAMYSGRCKTFSLRHFSSGRFVTNEDGLFSG